MWTRLDQAREDLQEAWRSIEAEKPQLDRKVIRTAAYIDLITDSFADVLNELRTNEEEVDVNILVDCLQSGIELLSSEEAELMMEEEEEEVAETEEDALTPHERRRRELGFKVQEAK